MTLCIYKERTDDDDWDLVTYYKNLNMLDGHAIPVAVFTRLANELSRNSNIHLKWIPDHSTPNDVLTL